MQKTIISVVAGLLLWASGALAGDCLIRVDRTPHPGKEYEAWAPYANRNPSAEQKAAKDEKECRQIAESNCAIKRKDVLKKKVVNARYEGKDLDGGGDLCKGVNP